MASSMHLDARDGPFILSPPSMEPHTTSSLTANLICRVMLAIIANLACLVPLRLLYRNNEFAAVVYIVSLLVQNLETILHSLLWSNNDFESWWPGYGLCDATSYVHNFSLGLFVTCLLAIIRNIAQQVGFLRANPLTVREKRKRNLVQALIMFPLPIVQVALTWPLTLQRYAVGTLIGCIWVAYPAWSYLVFFVLAPAIIAIITAGYAVLTFVRYRELAKTTRTALSSNRYAEMRAQRTKRRLYLMVVSVLIPFLPVVIGLTAFNIIYMGAIQPFDYEAIHNHDTPYPWNSITYYPYDKIRWIAMSTPYISIFAAVPLFLFFGMTKDAINDYRRILLFFGLGRFLPKLYTEYDPDRSRSHGSNSTGPSFVNKSAFGIKPKFTTSSHLGTTSSSVSSTNTPKDFNTMSSVDMEAGSTSYVRPPRPSQQPPYINEDSAPIRLPFPNPFLLRTRLDLPVPFTLPFFSKSTVDKGKQPASEAVPTTPLRRTGFYSPWDFREKPRVHTRVWSDEETGDGSRSHSRSHHDDEVVIDQGVMVETALTRESHQVGQH